MTPFLLLLRKYVRDGRLESLSQPPLERVLELRVSKRDDEGSASEVGLIIEVMGRRSNAVLVSEDGAIMDALRRASAEKNPIRPILPRRRYEPPPAQDRRLPFAHGHLGPPDDAGARSVRRASLRSCWAASWPDSRGWWRARWRSGRPATSTRPVSQVDWSRVLRHGRGAARADPRRGRLDAVRRALRGARRGVRGVPADAPGRPVRASRTSPASARRWSLATPTATRPRTHAGMPGDGESAGPPAAGRDRRRGGRWWSGGGTRWPARARRPAIRSRCGGSARRSWRTRTRSGRARSGWWWTTWRSAWSRARARARTPSATSTSTSAPATLAGACRS